MRESALFALNIVEFCLKSIWVYILAYSLVMITQKVCVNVINAYFIQKQAFIDKYSSTEEFSE